MKLTKHYSHLNGLEFLLVHKKYLWQEITDVITNVDASLTRTKVSSEKTRQGKVLYSPSALNKLFKNEFIKHNWQEMRTYYFVNEDLQTTKEVVSVSDENKQRQLIEAKGFTAYRTYNQVDFVSAAILMLALKLSRCMS